MSVHNWQTTNGAASRAPTSFDVWLNARLSGRPDAPIWLDQFALWAAAELALALGKTLAAGKDHLGRRSDPIAEHQIFDLGFSACHSEETVLEALTRHQMETGTPSDGQRRLFGPLYTLLGEERVKEDLAPFRDLLQRHIEATWPLGPGDEVLGEPVFDRRCFCVSTLAPFGSEDSRALHERAGGARSSQTSWSLINAADLAERLGSQQAGVTASQFRQSLGMTPQLFDQLHDAGALDAARRGNSWDFFEGQRLLDDVLRGAEPLVRPRSHWRSLAQAAHELGVSQPVVLMRARAGDFLRIGCDIRRHGIARIMIDLTGADGQPVPLAAFSRAQGLALADVEALVRAGLIEACEFQAPASDLFASPSQVPAVSQRAIVQFHWRFISRRSLGLAWRLSVGELALRLQARCISPVLGTRDVFSRQDI